MYVNVAESSTNLFDAMARRTKQDSAETRRTIIAAAREVFYHNGVARTSLEQVAEKAGVTRGAIYWHFRNKTELFYAMRDEVELPLLDRCDMELTTNEGADPLACVAHFIEMVIRTLTDDAATRRTFEIMASKCEYVDDFARDLENASCRHAELRSKLVRLYTQARRSGTLRDDLEPGVAASQTMIFLTGLIKIWLFDEDGKLVRKQVGKLIRSHMAGQRARPA